MGQVSTENGDLRNRQGSNHNNKHCQQRTLPSLLVGSSRDRQHRTTNAGSRVRKRMIFSKRRPGKCSGSCLNVGSDVLKQEVRKMSVPPCVMERDWFSARSRTSLARRLTHTTLLEALATSLGLVPWWSHESYADNGHLSVADEARFCVISFCMQCACASVCPNLPGG